MFSLLSRRYKSYQTCRIGFCGVFFLAHVFFYFFISLWYHDGLMMASAINGLFIVQLH